MRGSNVENIRIHKYDELNGYRITSRTVCLKTLIDKVCSSAEREIALPHLALKPLIVEKGLRYLRADQIARQPCILPAQWHRGRHLSLMPEPFRTQTILLVP